MLRCGARIKLGLFLRHDPVLYKTHKHPNNLIFAQSETARYYCDCPQARDSCIFLLHSHTYRFLPLHLNLLFPQSLITSNSYLTATRALPPTTHHSP